MSRLLFHLLLFALLTPFGCERQTAQPTTGAVQASAYEVKGLVKEIHPDGRRVSVAHEAIPGYMEAMTMEFDAADSRELAGLHSGDAITFRLMVTPEHGWIEQIRFRGAAATKAPIAPVPEVTTVLSAGDRLPAISLMDQTGRPFQLSGLGGRPLAFTFIFTRCPFPDYCPRLNAQFATVQGALKQEAAQLLSISIDPTHDTPARLAEYAAQYQPNPTQWRFATGDLAEIQRLGASFGLSVVSKNGTLDHNLRTVVVNATGRIEKVFSGNEWTAADLLEALKFAGAGE